MGDSIYTTSFPFPPLATTFPKRRLRGQKATINVRLHHTIITHTHKATINVGSFITIIIHTHKATINVGLHHIIITRSYLLNHFDLLIRGLNEFDSWNKKCPKSHDKAPLNGTEWIWNWLEYVGMVGNWFEHSRLKSAGILSNRLELINLVGIG